jgi:hypothetical protein
MKKLLPLTIILSLLSVLFVTENCSSSKDDPAPLPPNTDLNELFNVVYLASSGFQDAAKTQPIADGKQAFVIKDLVGDKEIVWANNRTIQSPLWPEVPTFYNDEVGGYILVPNVSETYWATKKFTEIPQPYDIYVVLRDLQAVANEGYFAVGVGLRNRNDHMELKVDSKGVTTAVELDKPFIFDFNKRSIVRIRVDGNKSSLWINNVQVTPTQVNLGSGGISDLGYGTNSHAAQHDFYGMWIKFGTLTSEEHTFVYDELVKQYKPGSFPDKPLANNIKIEGNSAATQDRIWTANYEYVGTGAEDVSKTEYQWGYYSIDAGQDLNTANYFTGANSKNKTLKRSDYADIIKFPGQNKIYIFVAVKVYDTSGNSWSHVVRSPLFADNY